MSFTGICENKILAKISGSTVYQSGKTFCFLFLRVKCGNRLTLFYEMLIEESVNGVY